MDSGGKQRLDAIKLAKGSKWEELRRLVDAEPLTAQQVDSYGMLPLHWACTEPHAISEAVLMALLKAYPQGARLVNTAEMVPLQIAIKAQAKIEWLQALLASYPDAVLKKTPTGEHAVELARKSNLPARSVRLLEEMYHHVCQKAGYSTDQLYDEDVGVGDYDVSPGTSADANVEQTPAAPARRPVPAGDGLQRYASAEAGVPSYAHAGTTRGHPPGRRPSHPDNFKARAFSENDFHAAEAMYRPTTSSNGSGGGSISAGSAKPLPYQTSTQLSSRTVVSLPPRWTNAPNCHICSQKFVTPFRKRHHCRNCGQSICSDHSARERMRLPHYGLPDRYRVCTVCHQTLKTAAKEMLQPSQTRLTTTVGLPARRSDEAVQRASSQQPLALGSGNGGAMHLERHVSAPVRSMGADTNYQGIHDQVASLQKQVSQLMEEKELAESQLRAQAELLGGAYNAERLTGMGRRDRLNSVPVKLPSGGSQPPPPAPSGPYNPSTDAMMTTRLTGSTATSEDAREREIDIDDHTSPSPAASAAAPAPPAPESRLQEEFGAMSFMSSYSEFDDRPTDAFSDLDGQSINGGLQTETLAEGDEDDGAQVYDDDDDDDGDEGDSTLPEVEVLANLGLAMLNKGSYSAAVQAFTRAVEICPDNAVLHSYLAKAHYADENLDDAVEALERSLELEPSAANSTLLGKILFEKGDHERAIQAYQKSLEIQNASQ